MAETLNTTPNPVHASGQRRERRSRTQQTEARWCYLLMSPWLLGFVGLTLGPMIASVYLSFCDYNMASPPSWIGVANYRRLWEDVLVAKSLGVTGWWVVGGTPLRLIVAFV